MLQEQIIARGVKDPLVLEAMRKVPREAFVSIEQQSSAYEDHPLPIEEGQTISQPYIVAFMTECLQLNPSATVLEVGTGSGYQTAILASIVKRVYTIEIIPTLAEKAKKTLRALGFSNITFRVGDGHHGWPEKSPFDGIIVTAAPERVPAALLQQLKIKSRLVLPVGEHSQVLKVIQKTETSFEEQTVLEVRFVPMRE